MYHQVLHSTRHGMYVKHNIEARSHNHCYCGQSVSNTYCVCLYFRHSYSACNAHLSWAILYCYLWPVCLYHVFPHYLLNGTIF